jgi:hypothetical protein
MLHNYHLYFDYLLKTVEEDKLMPELKQLSQSMLKTSQINTGLRPKVHGELPLPAIWPFSPWPTDN